MPVYSPKYKKNSEKNTDPLKKTTTFLNQQTGSDVLKNKVCKEVLKGCRNGNFIISKASLQI